jgi:hypothetical protein
MEDLKSKVIYVKEFMPKNLAMSITEYSKAHTLLFTEYGNGEKEFTVHTYHEIQRNDQSSLDVLQEYAKKVYDFVIENYEGPFQPFLDEKTHIAKFTPGEGMHEHYDMNRPNDIATILYLNNDYVGGDIYFPALGISHKPEPGDLLCFPDNPDYVHGVRGIEDGIRYTAPRWFTRIV